MKINKIQSNTNFGMKKVSLGSPTAQKAIQECQELYGAFAYFKNLETGDVCCFFGRKPSRSRRNCLSDEEYLNRIRSIGNPEYQTRANKTPAMLEEEMEQYLKDAGIEYETYPDPIILTEEYVQEFCNNNGWHIKPQEMHNHPIRKFFSMD